MIFFWVIVVIAIVLVIRYATRMKHLGQGPMEAPLDILKRRYAKGEISKEEFDRMREDLKG